MTRISKTSHFNEYFATNIKNSKNIWKGVNELIQGRKKYSNNTITLKIGNELHSDPKRVAEEFNKHFSSIADTIRAKISESDTDFRTSLKNSPAYSFFAYHIHTNEVTKIINSLGPKSAGPCTIPNTILKTVLIDISEILAKFCNLSIQTGIFPSSLKTAKVVPVFKNKGSIQDLTNYRPISLLSNIDKIFEKLIHSRVVKFLDQNNCLFNHQYGFRKKHSTIHALVNLTELIRANMDKGIYSCGIFIDLKKAFDTVDHEVLQTKLKHYGIRGVSSRWFRSYLHNRQQFVSVSGMNSKQLAIKHGVPPGSVLGPLLFLIYINDLANVINACLTLLFADDTCLLSSDSCLERLENKVNSALSCLFSWLTASKISLNANKTEVVLFRGIHQPINYNMNLLLENHHLQLSTTVRYLGLRLDQHLSWTAYVDFLASKLRVANGILAKLRYYIPLNTLISIYHALFHSHLSSAAIVWGQTLKNNSRISRLQNKAVRIITFSRYDTSADPLYIQTGILKFSKFIFYLNIKVVHEALNEILPKTLQNLFKFQAISHQHYTRNNKLKRLERPKTRNLNYGLKSIQYQAILNWNQLLLHTKEDLASFSKKQLKISVSDFIDPKVE